MSDPRTSSWRRRSGDAVVTVVTVVVVLGVSGWAVSQCAANTQARRQGAVEVEPTPADAGVHDAMSSRDLQRDSPQDQLHERAVRYCANVRYRGQRAACVKAAEAGDAEAVAQRSRDPVDARPYGP